MKWGIKEHPPQQIMSSAAPTTQKTTTFSNTVKVSRKVRRAQKEVTALQEKTSAILPCTTFKRIVTQTAADYSEERLRFNADAVQALQNATEAEITNLFKGAAFCAGIAKRDTVTIEDMRNFQQLRTM